ncbi:MAG TPA: tetratricopeptide repeat protein [Pyrinomonadaceae bacterium]|jgi:hypothetical protein|nr:tetratricopeptide repeat protein [Pyrinomonadaceae bacterium]
MTTVNDLHPQAMDLADEAFRLRRRGNDAEARMLFLRALELEQKAAFLLPATEASEPSRSILYRSAASLAYNAEDYEEAERLIAFGLSGFPPPEIRDELKNLYENINFMHHLKVQGITLSKNQWIMTIYGNATSFGGTLVEPLMHRVEKITTLFYRTVERLLGIEYRASGSTKKEIKDAYGLYVNAFAPSSFAVSFQIGAPDLQTPLFPDWEKKKPIEPDSVIDEVMKCFEILENEEEDELRERIHDETYYENFVGIAKQIAPDGNDIKFVGFKSLVGEEERQVALRKSREQLRNTFHITEIAEEEGVTKETYRGVLKFASSPISRNYGTVKLMETATGESHTIKVPIALMKDVVQPYYEERVSIIAFRKRNTLYLDEISPES